MNRILFFILISLVLLSFSCKRKNNSALPNVIIVLTDDQGYGDMSCHGNPVLKTPHLDRLHDEAVRFTNFHVAGICTPTRSQLMTGVDNLRNRACNWGYGQEYIRLDIPTMAEIFSKADYYTGQFGKWHLGDMFPHRPGDRGFLESVRFGGASIQQTPDYWDSDGFDDHYWHNDTIKQYKGYCTDIFFDEAMRFMLDCQTKERPFLTYIATGAVHDPCFVAEKYRKPYMDVKFNGELLPANVHSFFGMVSNLDENIGRLDQFLKDKGLRDNTILIFMSDNGGVQGIPIYDAGMRGKKGSLLEGGHRQSCFIRWPDGDLLDPVDVEGLTQIQDVLPTLIEFCNVDKTVTNKFDGISLAPLLRGEQQDLTERLTVVQWGWGSKGKGTVIWKNWRLTGGSGGWQLYDLDSDPYQEVDVLSDNPDIAKKMQEYYDEWWTELQPAISLYENPHIGNPGANPLTLTCFDYQQHSLLERLYGEPLTVYGGKYNLTIQPFVRNGMPVHGKWRLTAEKGGVYRIAIRRWPAEANAAITAGLPLHKLTDTYPEEGDRMFWYGTPQEGVELPVTHAKVKFGDYIQTAKVGQQDKKVEFTFALSAPGEVELETWFFDAEGQEICSAYYAEVEWGASF